MNPLNQMILIDAEGAGQRIDNFLRTLLKGVPKSRLYRALRSGEVRVNQKKVKPDYRLCAGDQLRLPPLRYEPKEERLNYVDQRLTASLEDCILFEDPELLVINKPEGIPVHGGTGIHGGLIETLRTMRPHAKRLELVHRLDRGTSGCLLIAKKRKILLELHQLLLEKKVKKRYLVLVKGIWKEGDCQVNQPLVKHILQSGERMVKVSPDGKASLTRFALVKQYPKMALLTADPVTGRTHQIRVHAAFLGHPVVGDEKYGDKAFNKEMRKLGAKRLFLHSASIYCPLAPERQIGVCVKVGGEWERFISTAL